MTAYDDTAQLLLIGAALVEPDLAHDVDEAIFTNTKLRTAIMCIKAGDYASLGGWMKAMGVANDTQIHPVRALVSFLERRLLLNRIGSFSAVAPTMTTAQLVAEIRRLNAITKEGEHGGETQQEQGSEGGERTGPDANGTLPVD